MATDIRRAGHEDAAMLALLGRLTFAETFGHLFRDHTSDLSAYLDATFDVAKIAASVLKPENTYWLAIRRGLPIGYAKLKQPSPPPGQVLPDAAQVQKIYLLHAFRGAGTGGDLLAPVMEAVAARSALVWLDVLRENEPAIRFYQRHGFAAIGEDTYTIGAQRFLFQLMARAVQ